MGGGALQACLQGLAFFPERTVADTSAFDLYHPLRLFITEKALNVVRVMTFVASNANLFLRPPRTYVTTTFTGNGDPGFSSGYGGATSSLSSPTALIPIPGGSFLLGQTACLQWISPGGYARPALGMCSDGGMIYSLAAVVYRPATNTVVMGGASMRVLTSSLLPGASFTPIDAATDGYSDGNSWMVRNVRGLLLSRNESVLYIADSGNCAIRQYRFDDTPSCSTILGSPPPMIICETLDGVGNAARLQYPAGMAWSVLDSAFYVAEVGGSVLRAATWISPNFVLSTFACRGGAAVPSSASDSYGHRNSILCMPLLAVAVHPTATSVVYFSQDVSNAVDMSIPSVVAIYGEYARPFLGHGSTGDGIGLSAAVGICYAMTFVGPTALFIADNTNHRMLRVDLSYQLPTRSATLSSQASSSGTMTMSSDSSRSRRSRTFSGPSSSPTASGTWTPSRSRSVTRRSATLSSTSSPRSPSLSSSANASSFTLTHPSPSPSLTASLLLSDSANVTRSRSDTASDTAVQTATNGVSRSLSEAVTATYQGSPSFTVHVVETSISVVQAAAEVGAAGSTSSTIVSLLASNPAAAQQAARASLLISLAKRCRDTAKFVASGAPRSVSSNATAVPSSDDEAAASGDAPTFPTALLPMVGRIGAVALWSAHRAVMIGNAVAAIAIVVGIVSVAAIRGILLRHATFATGLQLVRWPGVLLLPVGIVTQGTLSSGIFLLMTAGTPGTEGGYVALDAVLACVAATVALTALGAMTVVARWALRHAIVVTEAATTDEAASLSLSATQLAVRIARRLLGMSHRWTTLRGSRGLPDNDENSSPTEQHVGDERWLVGFGAMFEKYHGPAANVAGPSPDVPSSLRQQWSPCYTLFDYGCLLVCAIADGASGALPLRACTASVVASVVVNALSLLVVAMLRPFLSPAKNLLTIVAAAISAIASVCLVTAIMSEQDAVVARLVDWAATLSSTSAIISCVMGSLSLAQRIIKWCITERSPSSSSTGGTAGEEPQRTSNGASGGSRMFTAEAMLLDGSLLTAEDHARLENQCAAEELVEKSTVDELPAAAATEKQVHPAPLMTHVAIAPSAGRILDDLSDEDGAVSGDRPTSPQEPGHWTDADPDAALRAMTTVRGRTVRRTAEGQARYDELEALLRGTTSEHEPHHSVRYDDL